MEMEAEVPECARGIPRGTKVERFRNMHVTAGDSAMGFCDCGVLAHGQVSGKSRLLCYKALDYLERLCTEE